MSDELNGVKLVPESEALEQKLRSQGEAGMISHLCTYAAEIAVKQAGEIAVLKSQLEFERKPKPVAIVSDTPPNEPETPKSVG